MRENLLCGNFGKATGAQIKIGEQNEKNSFQNFYLNRRAGVSDESSFCTDKENAVLRNSVFKNTDHDAEKNGFIVAVHAVAVFEISKFTIDTK